MGTKQVDDGQWSANFSLEDLKVFLGFVRAQEGKPNLTMGSHTDTEDGGKREYKRLERSMSKIEDDLGCHLVHPNPGGNRTSDLTLDGRVWAEFADLVTVLYEMTRSAIDQGPMKATSTHRPRVRTDPTVGRRNILAWLRHQNAAVRQAKYLSDYYSVPVYQAIDLVAQYNVQVEEFEDKMQWGELAPVFPDHDKMMEAKYGDDSKNLFYSMKDSACFITPKVCQDDENEAVDREVPIVLKYVNAAPSCLPHFWFQQRYHAHVLSAAFVP